MFTGIVEEVGTVVAIGGAPGSAPADQDLRLSIRGPIVTSGARRGDSIALSLIHI